MVPADPLIFSFKSLLEIPEYSVKSRLLIDDDENDMSTLLN